MRAIVLIVVSAATASAQQQLPTRTLAKPDIEYAEPFSQVTSIRELRDGRVIVADPRDKSLQAIDLKASAATKIGREGSGPAEYAVPGRLFAMPGDSTFMVDQSNSRFLVIGPDARAARTFSPAADAALANAIVGGRGAGAGTGAGAGAGAAGGRGAAAGGAAGGAAVGGAGAGGRANFGGGGGMNIRMTGAGVLSARYADARGRLYYQGLGMSVNHDMTVKQEDSLAIIRYDPKTDKHDTVAFYGAPKADAKASGSQQGQERTMVMMSVQKPFTPADDWAVLPDGRVAIARVSDYHLEIVQPDGKRIAGAPVRFTPVKVTEKDKQAYRDSRRGGRGSVTINGVAQPLAPPPEPTEWPEFMPAFGNQSVLAAPNGDVWILRSRGAGDNVPAADVFDARGKHVGRVLMPERTRLVGFGSASVYLVRLDDDDLQYLQRHAMQWTGCAAEIKEVCTPR